jgi:serine protease AprX
MAFSYSRPKRLLIAIALFICACGSAALPQVTPSIAGTSGSYIVQADSADAAAAAVVQAGGAVTRSLPLVDGVVATLDQQALAWLRRAPRIILHINALVQATGKDDKITEKDDKETETGGYYLYPAAATGVSALHDQQVTTRKTACKHERIHETGAYKLRPLQGWGVTVAVIDSGFMKMRSAGDWKHWDEPTGTLVAEGDRRCIVYRDFLPRIVENGVDVNQNSGANARNSADQNGHGTHVISTIADNRATDLLDGPAQDLSPVGVAPKVNLLVARVLDKDGAGTYGDVISAIEWVIANKDTYKVRVLNLSLYAPVTGPYWADPLNQAVMRAWQSGIVVVAAAGNDGPTAGTITVPGNVPYVITSGALRSGRYNASGYDELAAFSSRGPTESAFVKPDVLVPGVRTIAPMPDDSVLAGQVAAGRILEHAQVDYGIGKPAMQHTYYQLSGTSMAAAQVSGLAALMLQAAPSLTPDQVKYRMLATAVPAIDQASGELFYSVWEQGAGLVNPQQAVFTTTAELANVGMDISLDLDFTREPQEHYWGYTTWDEATGEFRLIDPSTGQPLAIWDGGSKTWAGGSKTWAGGSKTWAGGSKTWAGGSKTWAGGSKTWAGSESFWAGGSKTWAGSTPATSPSTASASEVLGYADPATALPLPVRPILECVTDNGSGKYTAYFGYTNENPIGASIPIGVGNAFSPGQQSRGQPTTFEPGRTLYWPEAAFKVDFSSNSLTWTLNGQTAIASNSSPRCQP